MFCCAGWCGSAAAQSPVDSRQDLQQRGKQLELQLEAMRTEVMKLKGALAEDPTTKVGETERYYKNDPAKKYLKYAAHYSVIRKALTTLFNFPKGIAYDSKGNLSIADMNNHCIRKLSSYGIVTTFAK